MRWNPTCFLLAGPGFLLFGDKNTVAGRSFRSKRSRNRSRVRVVARCKLENSHSLLIFVAGEHRNQDQIC